MIRSFVDPTFDGIGAIEPFGGADLIDVFFVGTVVDEEGGDGPRLGDEEFRRPD